MSDSRGRSPKIHIGFFKIQESESIIRLAGGLEKLLSRVIALTELAHEFSTPDLVLAFTLGFWTFSRLPTSSTSPMIYLHPHSPGQAGSSAWRWT